MDIKATKEWWNEICLAKKMTPDEAATLVHTVDELIAEVERLQGELKSLDGQICKWRHSSNRHLLKLIKVKGEMAQLQFEADVQALTVKILKEKLYGTGGVGDVLEAAEAVRG